MATKMKGLLKGLRYISQIFDTKEQEMQIGYPTDVKHVAHIGWDGPSLNSPSWMNEFRSTPLSTTVGGDTKDSAAAPPQQPHQDLNLNGGGIHESSAAREASELPLPRPSRRNGSSSGTGVESPRAGPRQSRRHQSAGHVFMGSPGSDTSESSKHGRRSKPPPSAVGGGGGGSDPPLADLPAIPRQSRRKKTKGSTSGGSSSRSSRTKAAHASFSDPGTDDDPTAERLPSLPALKPAREEQVF